MSTRPLVSAVIPTKDRRRMLARAVASIRNQTYTPMEIIIVDDGSSDGTYEDWATAGDVRYVPLETSVGAGAARNLGVRMAAGDLIAFLDSDDEWRPEKIAQQVTLLAESPRSGAVYCRHYAHDDTTGVRREPEVELYTGDITEQLMSGRCPHTVSLFVVRKEAFDSVGGFDESLRGFQDTDLWIRMAANWRFEAVDEPLAILHDHATTRITTDIDARRAALDGFLGKWGNAMAERIGDDGVSAYRTKHLAVAQGHLVLGLVRDGMRGRALDELRRYLVIAGLSNPRQLVGLLIAVIAGPGAHGRIKGLRQRILA